MQLHVIETRDEAEFVSQAATFLAQAITDVIQERGGCIIGLSGGSTPKSVYEALGKISLDWDSVLCFLIDERYIPADNKDSNQKLVRESLVAHARIPETNLIFPDTSLPIDACVEHYARDLMVLFDKHLADIVVLGMGNDGHIASLFPPMVDSLMDDSRLVAHTQTDQFVVHDRITVTLNPIAAANHAVFLLNGMEKKKVWDAMMLDFENERRWPAKRILASTEVTVVWGM
ncbi:MAG: 6-phosphogluconolactonase [Candidatus Peregrinibacteria bacterium Greene1014_49]|nr:MAG: 6-phosphogluconolactonase [Candidatus Peregrinibacteria bacterium Greene1014_49]